MAYLLITIIWLFFVWYSAYLIKKYEDRIQKLESTILTKDHKINDLQTSYNLIQDGLEKETKKIKRLRR